MFGITVEICFIGAIVVLACLYIHSLQTKATDKELEEVKEDRDEKSRLIQNVDEVLRRITDYENKLGYRYFGPEPLSGYNGPRLLEMAKMASNTYEKAREDLMQIGFKRKLYLFKHYGNPYEMTLLELTNHFDEGVRRRTEDLENRIEKVINASRITDKCGYEINGGQRVAYAKEEVLATTKEFQNDGRMVIEIKNKEEKIVHPCKLRRIDVDEEEDPQGLKEHWHISTDPFLKVKNNDE